MSKVSGNQPEGVADRRGLAIIFARKIKPDNYLCKLCGPADEPRADAFEARGVHRRSIDRRQHGSCDGSDSLNTREHRMMFRSILFCLAVLGGLVTVPAAAQGGGAAPVDEQQVYDEAARQAWAFVDKNYVPETGLVRATDHYDIVTVWDVGSGLLALYSANELGLLPDPEYEARMRRALQTLYTAPLFDDIAYNRAYSARTAQMVLRNDQPTTRGTGWSALDMGRLLSALKVVASNHTQFEGEVDRVVKRLRMDQMVRDGYLWGANVNRQNRVDRYPEGRMGYEQYAAQGFAVWGHRAEKALDVTANARRVNVLGVPLLADRRGEDRITSEPFVLAALEMDLWGSDLGNQARAVLAAQEARYRQTGQVTVVSEDALPVEPYHFYYYNVYHDGKPFVIDAQASMRGVRVRPWISTKATFGWNAVMPGDYTRTALQTVADAHRGASTWSAGIYEGTNERVGDGNVNTAAVILESALYRKQRHRLMRPEQRKPDAGGTPDASPTPTPAPAPVPTPTPR